MDKDARQTPRIFCYSGYANAVAASQACAIMSMHWQGIMMYGWIMLHISGRAMFKAQLQQQSAVLGIAQHISRRSWSGGTKSTTFCQMEKI